LKSNSELLAQLIADERKQGAPELDWDAIEARIEARIAKEAPVRRRSGASRWSIVALAAAVALSVGWAVKLRHSTPPLATKTTQAIDSNYRDAAKLAVRTRLTAEHEEVLVEHRGRASWTLEPGSSAVLLENGKVIQVELTQGTLIAQVVPQPVPETFVVLAGDVRVAVHGTRFSVEKSATSVSVSVKEGVVTATFAGHDSVRLEANESAIFDANGEVHASRAADDSTTRHGSTASSKARHPNEARTANEPSAPEANEPTISEVEEGVSRIVSLVNGCFAEHTATNDDVHVTVRSTLSFRVEPSGHISSVHFEPPLAPTAQNCVDESLASVTFTQSVKGIDLSRVLELSR
jgi:hypothetical protein